MRSQLMIVAAVVVSVFLTAQTAAADPVQEQLRLMEQRLAEMEDRLSATSDELKSAQETVDEQQGLLTDAGLVESDDRGLRSATGNFLKEVDISGVAAASYNYRFIDGGDENLNGGNDGFFRHPDANTFALDQIWLVVDKTPTSESRGGFHAEWLWGKTADSQALAGGSGGDEGGLLYNGYVSYLAPIGEGIQFDVGKLATPLGAEVLQTNMNYNITTGRLFGLQPVTHVGVQASTQLTDELGFTFGIVNDVYTATNADLSDDKAYYAQVSFGTEKFGANVGAIVGQDSGLACNDPNDQCKTSVFDVVLTANPTDNVGLWLNFDWARTFGDNTPDGDAYGVAGAGRVGITDNTGIAGRIEYIRQTASYTGTGISEFATFTVTGDQKLAEGLKLRGELRYDVNLSGDRVFANGGGTSGTNNNAAGDRLTSSESQMVGLLEILYEF